MTAPTSHPAADHPQRTPADHTHGCARCGAPVPLDVGLCERCNPLGLRDSASSQVHGTVFLGVGFAIVALALLARLAVAGIGPFEAVVVGVHQQDGGLAVSIRVTNEGTSTGSASCRITDAAVSGGQRDFIQSPRIDPKATITFDAKLTTFGTEVRPFAVECFAP